jgi:phospholipase C
MRIPLKSLILFAVILISLNAKVSPSNKIKKIILVCMENHSYDNMLGFLDSPIGDLDGSQF